MREQLQSTSLEHDAQWGTAVARPVRVTQQTHVSRLARGDQMSPPETAVALQEAQVEPAREVQVHTQHKEKLNESCYCSIVGCGHISSLETEVISAWARQGSVLERHAIVENPAGAHTENHS